MITEALGIPLAVSLTGGNRNDVTQLMPLIEAIPPVRGRRGRPAPSPGEGLRRGWVRQLLVNLPFSRFQRRGELGLLLPEQPAEYSLFCCACPMVAMTVTCFWLTGCVRGAGGHGHRADGGRRDGAAIREQFARVVEQHDTVAQQTPPLLGMADRNVRGADRNVRGAAIWSLRIRARGPVLAHLVLRNGELTPGSGAAAGGTRATAGPPRPVPAVAITCSNRPSRVLDYKPATPETINPQ